MAVEEKDIQRYESLKDTMLDFVEKKGGLKKTGEKETVYITDYTLEDGKVNAFVQLGSDLKYNFKEYTGDILISAYFILITLFTIFNLFKLVRGAILVDNTGMITSPLFFFLISVITIVMWLLSTSGKIISLTGYKYKFLKLTTFIIFSWFTIITYDVFSKLAIPLVARIEVTPFMTEEKIILLAYILTILPTIAITFIAARAIVKVLYTSSNLESIRKFKLKHYIKPSKDSSKYNYDLSFFRDDLTGKKVVIEEHDRYIHSETIGATGSGKTSSLLLPVINSDLNKKALNEDAQKKVIAKWIKKGWCYLTKAFDDIDFSINHVQPNPGYEDKFRKEVLKYRSAGLTVMAPDDSLTDTVYELSKAKGFKCNRIDAKRDSEGNIKEGSIGFNPLYISPLVPEWRRNKEIIKKATLFSDIMQIMYDMSGKSDPYFSSINRIATTTTAITLMLTYPLLNNGKQPTPQDIEYIINDYSRIKKYYDKLVQIDKDGFFQSIRDTISSEFMGEGREKFQEHSKGLKVQINNFLIEPEIRRILCSEHTVDLDKMLSNGEITVVNIELGDLGPVNSPAFGLFFSIAFQNAVLSRAGDEWSRLPHFWTIDEFPVLVSPSIETSLVLFRKFRCAMFLAMQTFDQLNKNPFLMYLKGIILNSCAHHFIFGRTNTSDGEIISELGGKIDEITYQEGATSTSILNDQPTASFQKRYTVEQKERITADQQRHLDFQEITYFITEKGRALPPRYGKVYFLSNKDKRPIKRLRLDWRELLKEQTVVYKAAGDFENITEQTNDDSKHESANLDDLKTTEPIKLDENINNGIKVSMATTIRENVDSPIKEIFNGETVSSQTVSNEVITEDDKTSILDDAKEEESLDKISKEIQEDIKENEEVDLDDFAKML